MTDYVLNRIDEALRAWQPPEATQDMPQGDMPGDKVWIGPQAIEKAQTAFRALLPLLREALAANPARRAVVAVTGGSGVGKTCVSALLTYYLNQLGVGAYTHSGDNYPRRIPAQNDAERMRIFRFAGTRALVEAGAYSPERAETLRRLQREDTDSDPAQRAAHAWLAVYQAAGREALSGYLGTGAEQSYEEIGDVLRRFRAGEDKIWLRRLGRGPEDLWYEEKDFSGVSVMVLEWTHGNSGLFEGVDIPVLLSSTPAETRAYRLARGRDANADTAFITMVLELEQAKLEARAEAAKLIVSKACRVLSLEEYKSEMNAGR